MRLNLVWSLLLITGITALDNGLGRKPQMGFNTWNYFGCNINETLMFETVDTLVSSGLAALGYEYLNLDDCWMGPNRDENGNLVADPDRFPSGMAVLADYAHSNGLKFGLYSSAGYETCQGLPASLGYEQQDANSFASWGVDYLKYDNCNTDGSAPEVRYPPMSTALNASGRAIFFSMCEWGVNNPAAWAQNVGNSWRTTGDISDHYLSFIEKLDITESRWPYAEPGSWNDPDMLEVGNGGMTFDEYKAHFSLWSLIKAPLIIGCDIRSMSDETKEILMNEEVIAINQDDLGIAGRRVWSDTKNLMQVDSVVSKCGAKGMDQSWYFDKSGRIVNTQTNECLTIHLCNPLNEARVIMGSCDTEKNLKSTFCDKADKWTLNSDGTITSQLNGKCLDVNMGKYAQFSGRRVEMFTCNGGQNQKWTLNEDGTLVNEWQSQCLSPDIEAPVGTSEVWSGPISNDNIAVVLFNRGLFTKNITVNWEDIGLESGVSVLIRDLWEHNDVGIFSNAYTAEVVSHGIVMVKLMPQ